MATAAIRNTAVIPANENTGESMFRSIYNTIVRALKPHHSLDDLEMMAARNRTNLTNRDRDYMLYATGIVLD
jgi:hypothetical protein